MAHLHRDERTDVSRFVRNVPRSNGAKALNPQVGALGKNPDGIHPRRPGGSASPFRRSLRELPRKRWQRKNRDGPESLPASAGYAPGTNPEPDRRRDLLHHRERYPIYWY